MTVNIMTLVQSISNPHTKLLQCFRRLGIKHVLILKYWLIPLIIIFIIGPINIKWMVLLFFYIFIYQLFQDGIIIIIIF